MIRRVRRQFICITMAMLTTVLLIPLIALNVITEAMSYNQTRNLLEQIAISETAVRQMPDGAPPDGKRPQETTDAVPAAGSDTSTKTTVTTTDSTTTTAETTTVQTERAPAETKAAGSGAPAPAAVQTQPPTPRQTAAPKATTAAPRATTARQTKAPVTTTKAVVSRETKPVATQLPQPDPPRQTEPDLPPDPPPWWGWDDPPHDYEDNRENYAARQPVLYAMPLASLAQSVPMNNGGRNAPPFPDKRGDVVTIDHFLCFANAEGTLMRLDGTENYTEDDAQTMLDYVLEKGKTDGWYGSLQYFRKDYDRGTLVVFSDRSAEQLLLHKVLLVSILVFLLMEGVVFLLTMILTKRAMRPMQETFERQRQFISDAGHELKTPLQSIIGSAELLENGLVKPEDQPRFLSRIHQEADRLVALINDILRLSQLDEGGALPHEQVSVLELAQEAARSLTAQAAAQAVHISVTGTAGTVFGVRRLLYEIARNLCENAVKYNVPGGSVTVEVAETDRDVALLVRDTGIGIPEGDQSRVFERFYRVDKSHSRAIGGTGLGLSIVKHAVAYHHGTLRLESQPGKGTVITVTLPKKPTE